MQLKGFYFSTLKRCLQQNAVLRPLKGITEIVENNDLAFLLGQADVIKILVHVPATGKIFWDLAEDKKAVPFRQHVLDLFKYVRGGDVDRLYPAHIEDDVGSLLEFRFNRGI